MKRWPFGIFENRIESKFKLSVEPEPVVETEPAGPVKFKIGGKEVDPAAAEAAMNLYNALQDKDTSELIIENLATKAGFVKGDQIVDKSDKTGAKLEGRIHKMMKAKLGKDFEKFSDTIGPLLDDAISEYVSELKQGIEERSGATGWEGEVEKFSENHSLSSEVEAEMERLIKRNGGVPKGLKGKAAQEYLTDHYELAVNKLGVEPPTRKTNRNRTAIDEIPEFREMARPTGPLSLDRIIDDAMKGIRYKS